MPIILMVDDDDAIRAILYGAAMISVLIADDHAVVRRGLRQILSEQPDICVEGEASTADEALQYLEVEDYDAILTDIEMPGLDGISLLKRVQLRDADTPVIFISGKGTETDRQRLIDLGAFAYLTKPFHLDEVEKIIEQALARKDSEQSK